MSESDELVRVSRSDDGVAVVTLADGKINALSVALLQQLQAAAEDLTAEPPGAVVVTGATASSPPGPRSPSSSTTPASGRPGWPTTIA